MNNKLIKSNFNNFSIFSYDESLINFGKDVILKNYTVLKSLKDTPRNYVAIIEYQGKKYVLKEPRNEYRIPQRKFFTLFKKGEVLTTLENIHSIIYNYNFKEFVEPLICGNTRKNGMITSSFLLMEFISGESINNSFHKNRIVEIMKKVHLAGFIHGDCNPSNFIFDKNDCIYILDTQGKKARFTNFSKHYDMITMKYDSYPEMIYPYKKDFIYYLAYSLKYLKRTSVFKIIKNFKKKLRDLGWKI